MVDAGNHAFRTEVEQYEQVLGAGDKNDHKKEIIFGMFWIDWS